MTISRDIVEILMTPTFQAVTRAQGAEVAPGTPEELAAFVKSEILKWGQIIRVIGIKPE